MGVFLTAVGRALYLLAGVLIWGAVGVYNRIAAWAPAYLWSLAITAAVWLALIPTFTAIKVVAGWVPAAYLAAFLAVLLTAIIGLLWSPLGILIGLLLGQGREVGERYVRFVGVVLFTELMLAMYVLVVPFHRNLGMVPFLLIAAAAVGLGTAIWGGWVGGRFYVGVAIAAVIMASLSFLFPDSFHTAAAEGGRIDSGLAAVLRGEASVQAIFWVVVLLFVMSWLIPALVKKEQAALQKITRVVPRFLAVAILAHWFIWGSGASAVAPRLGAAPSTKPAKLITVPLQGPSREVSLQGFLKQYQGVMPPWRYKVDQREVQGLLQIVFTDGSKDTLAPGEKKEFGKTRYPAAFAGDGTVYLWLCPRPPCW